MEHGLPILGNHNHIDPSIDCFGAPIILAAADLSNTVPIADHKALKSQLTPQHIGQELAITVDFIPVPTVERGHHRLHIGSNRSDIPFTVTRQQLVEGHTGIALIGPPVRATISDIVLGRCDNAFALHCRYIRPGETLHYTGVSTERLIGPAPSQVSRDRNGGRKHPVNAGRPNLSRSSRANTPDQIGVPHRSEGRIVRK